MTLNDHIELLRLNRAPALLVHQDANVPRIAMNPGFGSLSTFNKSIRKLIGMARSNFRKGLASARQAHAWHGKQPIGQHFFSCRKSTSRRWTGWIPML
ncbi:helix-turn-helix domain-containing protein [Mesorhizobium sp. B2-4-12]|uniref:helix-turn-helix domain-containing protein n=1 Tax=Mesorhizobium sp. B2-4-12 TaxID=2589937 RepID=UPI001126264E|nr:helix-turn-helix domain-containing protein [Mesorhizobium sp. B2-4-12]